MAERLTRRSLAVDLAVVGSLALDTIATPAECKAEVLGGSASYACAAASFFARPGMVAVAGSDFPQRHERLFARLGIDTSGLQRRPGRTFRWSGVYETDMNVRRTIRTCLNVFADFSPTLPSDYTRAPFIFLANIAPELQLHVLDQARNPRFVATDTMDLWIRTARPSLLKVISRSDMLLLNDSEARMLTGELSLPGAAKYLLRMGPRCVVLKKGEHGSMLFERGGAVFALPAFPVERVRDPTGAGDSFAGGMLGWLASRGVRPGRADLRMAMAYGTVLASFSVERFGPDRFASLLRRDVNARFRAFRSMIAMPPT